MTKHKNTVSWTVAKAWNDRYKKQMKADTPPDFCYSPIPDGKSGNMKLPRGCVYCRHKFECHKDSNIGMGLRVFKYAKKFEYLTNVAKLPRVQEVTNEWKKKQVEVYFFS